MGSQPEASSASADIRSTLRQRINIRTWRGIRQLQIDVTSDCVFITGVTSSYYLKQLALEAVKEIARSGSLPPVALNIQVQFHDARPVATREYA